MNAGAFDTSRLGRLRDVMARHVASGDVPGLVTLVSRRGETWVEALGARVMGGDPMRRDTIFRISSMSKPVTAAATMILVEAGTLRLDEPVDRLLPELANRRVLRRLDGPLDDTVPAKRPISLRDLLTLRMGLGYIFAPPGSHPIMAAANAIGILCGPPQPQSPPEPDAWMRALGTLPLMHQPGEAWMYDVGIEVLSVLIARAAGQPLDVFLRERLFEPLGMKDTGFSVPAAQLDRLSGCYRGNRATGALEAYDPVVESQWSRPPAFPAGASGLVSTVDDYLAFCRMLLEKGRSGSGRILSRRSVDLMTTDQLTPEQRAGGGIILGESGWGLGLAVDTRRDLATTPGRFGWTGGLGTSAYTDPSEDLIGIVMTSRMMDSPQTPPVFLDFWTTAYQALDD